MEIIERPVVAREFLGYDPILYDTTMVETHQYTMSKSLVCTPPKENPILLRVMIMC